MIIRPTEILTKRHTSLLASDLAKSESELAARFSGQTCLVIGGAGSIGSETTLLLTGFELKSLTIVDTDENGLARLMRRIRARSSQTPVQQIHTLPVDYGSHLFTAACNSLPPFDFVLNFAALKHVRSEKDVWSTFQMMDTNILKQADLLEFLGKHSPDARYFSVSTDKAANPVSFMGATKRLMEHVIFAGASQANLAGGATSARFANVAYSQGSLLESFVQRLDEGVPLAAPEGIRRFFMTLQEAGEFCLLASILGESDNILIPKLDPENHLVGMKTAASAFLEANRFTPAFYSSDKQAAAFTDFEELRNAGKWPVIITPSDTAGEKPYEEFSGEGETPVSTRFEALQALQYDPGSTPSQLRSLLERLRQYADNPELLTTLTSSMLMDWAAEVEPEFRSTHLASSKSLDDQI